MPRKPTGFEGVPLDRWEALKGLQCKELRDPGPEWLSTTQLAEVWGLCRVSTQRRVRRLKELGMVEESVRDVLRGNGSPVPVAVFKLREGV